MGYTIPPASAIADAILDRLDPGRVVRREREQAVTRLACSTNEELDKLVALTDPADDLR